LVDWDALPPVFLTEEGEELSEVPAYAIEDYTSDYDATDDKESDEEDIDWGKLAQFL
jgi:hypothetical protein